jgi:YfiH family protein
MIISKKVLVMEKWKIYKIFNEQKNLIAGSTTKDLAKSYDFSLATHTGEDLKLIMQNRDYFASFFNKDAKFVTLNQTHSNKVIDISKYKKDEKWINLQIDADAMVTNEKNIVLNILTADCSAILAYDKNAKIIGAAHAGWRGTKDNIAINLISKMVSCGANKKDILIAISPCIKSCCYEVDFNVAKYFLDFKDAIVKTSKDKWHLDIAIVNFNKLLDFGIKEQNIEISKICTSCNNKDYFSYRKECGCSGRFINFIVQI